MPDRDAARPVGDSDRSQGRRPRQVSAGLGDDTTEGVVAMKA